ncbi:chitinase protein PB1E7.04c isoform X1 [Spatholobus suberectus]|nr:chitinase protein PB1E7.04c isoform X1 [Spatholobus suberectus]
MISEPASSLRRSNVQDRRLSIIDVSSADDSLLDPLSENHQHSENQEHADLLYTPNSKKFEDAATKLEQWEHEPHSNDASGIGKPKKNSKCNLRKSLAWDSAFFTGAGVLDPEELSSIIEGVEKHELPDIQEDVYKSCESISTLASDSLTFESVEMEGDLFEDVRASIQKSSKKSSPAGANTKLPPSSAVPGFQTHDSSKKVGLVSRNKMKAPPASKNPSVGMQGFGKMTKKNNPIFPQLPQPAATRRESSILKQSKVPGKSTLSSTISSKRESLGNLHVKSERDKAKRIVGDRVSSVTKASVIGGSRRTVPKPTLPSKSPSGPSVSARTKSVTSTSSAVKTPSRIASINKAEHGISSLSSLMSAAKLSSSVSPSSSISDWSSSESSSSTYMAKRVCNSSRSSLDSGSSRKVLSDTDAVQGTNSQIPQSDSSLERQEAQHTGFISQKERTAPGATVLPPAPKKPSGLRLPSPKIGFFDGVKPLVRTPRGGLQPRSVVPGGLPKHGAESPSEGQNKAELGKLQPSRSIMSIENTKPNNQQAPQPHPFHESLEVATKTSNSVQNVKSSSDIPMGAVQNTSLFHVVEKAHHDLLPLKGVNNQENAHHDDEIDCLSKQVGLMDIKFETWEKFNGDSLSLLQTDISSQDKFNGLEFSSRKELIDCPKKEELLKGSSTTCLSVSPTSFDMEASTRRPFAVKDSFCNMDDIVFTESTVSETKQTSLPVPESIIMKENK